MKTNVKGALVLLSGIVLLYSACKKDSKQPVATTPTPTSQSAGLDVVSSQVALNFYQSLSGAYGGVNLNNGITSPGLAAATGKSLNSLGSSATCAFFVDTTIDFKTNIGDSIKSESTGGISFFFKCNHSGQHFGFINDDSLLTVGKAPGYTFTYDLTQHYDVTALNGNDRLFNVDGKIKSFVDIDYKKRNSWPLSVHNKFDFKGVIFDLKKGDVIAGKATFESKGTANGASWDYIGKAEFIGAHRVEISINGLTFIVNLITGKVTPV